MKVVFTKHSLDKFNVLKDGGWIITKKQINSALQKPGWAGKSRFGQETSMILIDDSHILRVIFDRENDIIKIITFHIARRGKYESTLR